MKGKSFLLVAFVSVLCAPVASPEEDVSKKIDEINAQIEKTPDAPMLYYRKAQCLMKLARYDEGYETARKAMELFIRKNQDLAWMLLEAIDLGNVRVDVHFNMGDRERKPPEIGIVRPLSFRVWTKEEDVRLLEIIDFEIGMAEGKPNTAALGKETGKGHSLLAILEKDAKYEHIRKKAIELIRKRHPGPQRTNPPDDQ